MQKYESLGYSKVKNDVGNSASICIEEPFDKGRGQLSTIHLFHNFVCRFHCLILCFVLVYVNVNSLRLNYADN